MCFDEFTSTVDRNVAISTVLGIKKYIVKHNLKKVVFCSCHKDYIDYTIDNKKTEINNFCIYNNLEYLNYCASNNMYTIKPIEISNYPLKKTKEVIKNGSILIYNVNNEFINEYELILNYIKSKGFIVVDISKLISE